MELFTGIGPIFALLGGIVIGLLLLIYYVVINDRQKETNPPA